MVADPLELERHVIERQQEAEVARDRRLRGDRHQDQCRDLALRLVDPASPAMTRVGELGVALDERPDGVADLLLDERAHPQDPGP